MIKIEKHIDKAKKWLRSLSDEEFRAALIDAGLSESAFEPPKLGFKGIRTVFVEGQRLPSAAIEPLEDGAAGRMAHEAGEFRTVLIRGDILCTAFKHGIDGINQSVMTGPYVFLIKETAPAVDMRHSATYAVGAAASEQSA